MSNPAGLTLRELEVELLAEHGATYKEIALVLGVEVSTVQSLMKLIRKKYAAIGVHRGRRYLMTAEQYQQRLMKLTRELRARHAFLNGVATNGKEKSNGDDARGEGQKVCDGVVG